MTLSQQKVRMGLRSPKLNLTPSRGQQRNPSAASPSPLARFRDAPAAPAAPAAAPTLSDMMGFACDQNECEHQPEHGTSEKSRAPKATYSRCIIFSMHHILDAFSRCIIFLMHFLDALQRTHLQPAQTVLTHSAHPCFVLGAK
jgi:hypothetical protein